MQPKNLLQRHPVFHVSELNAYFSEHGTVNTSARNAWLSYHKSRGRLISPRKRLYVSVPPGRRPEEVQPDPYLMASRMTPGAVVGYWAALVFHGLADPPFKVVTVIAETRAVSFQFSEWMFKGVTPPTPLRVRNMEGYGVENHMRSGLSVRVTSAPRTLVDAFCRPDLCGGLEAVERSAERFSDPLEVDALVEYAALLESATAIGRAAALLEARRKQLDVTPEHFERLRAARTQAAGGAG